MGTTCNSWLKLCFGGLHLVHYKVATPISAPTVTKYGSVGLYPSDKVGLESGKSARKMDCWALESMVCVAWRLGLQLDGVARKKANTERSRG